MTSNNWIDAIAFNEQGLIPAIAQDKETGKILMMAWMNRESLHLTAQNKVAVYYSRSRQALWRKGETSGHTQIVHDIFLDCDSDAIVLLVTQVGAIACHTGRQSCFYKRLNLDHLDSLDKLDNLDNIDNLDELGNSEPMWQTVEPVIKDPKDIYSQETYQKVTSTNTFDSNTVDNSIDSNANSSDNNNHNECHHSNIDAMTILRKLDTVLAERKRADADSSYVASLYDKGLNKILEKVGEESIETIIAAKELAQYLEISTDHSIGSYSDNDSGNHSDKLTEDLIYEVADVWFHTLITLVWFNVSSDQVLHELARRFGLSGITEKASR